MAIPPRPPRDIEEQPAGPDTADGVQAWFGWLWHPISRRLLILNIFVLLASAVAILLTSEPDIRVDPQKAIRHLSVVVFTIATVEFIWNVFVRVEQERNLRDDRKLLIQEVHRELQELYKIRDTAVLAVDTQLSLRSRIEECSGEIFIVKIYLPDAQRFFAALKPRIKKRAVKHIRLVFLDNRPGSDGARLHQERAETMRGPVDSRLELRNSINAACHFARDVIAESSLQTFEVYLCNQLPTISVTQLSTDRAYLAFFFYNVNSVDSPQFHVDLNKRTSSIVAAYTGHKKELLSRIRAEHEDPAKDKCIFNLRKRADIEELEALQQPHAILKLPAGSASARAAPESSSP